MDPWCPPPRSCLLALPAFLLLFASLAPALAVQEESPSREPSIAIVGARVLPISGPPLEGATVLITGEQIAAVGMDVEIPEGATVVEANGRTLAPGWIDAASYLFLRKAEIEESQGAADSRVLDGVDPFERTAAEAVSQGVTSVLLVPGGQGTVAGLAALVDLTGRRGERPEVVLAEAALKATLGVEKRQSTPFNRLRQAQSLRSAFEGAKKYKEAWEKYRKDLEEYERKKKEGEKADGKESGAGEAKEEKEQEGKGGQGRDEDGQPSAAAPSADKDGDFWLALSELCEEILETEQAEDPTQIRIGRFQRGGPPATTEKDEKGKKPKKPRREPDKEILVRALDAEIPVLLEVQRREDIARALTIANEFGLRLILLASPEAHLVAEDLAREGVDVVVAPIQLMESPPVGYEHFSPGAAGVLHRDGVAIAIGTLGSEAGGSRFLRHQAALAVANGLPREAALEALTLAPARMLGVDDRIGSIQPGRIANLVLYGGDPLDVRSEVERVFIRGREVRPR